MTARRTYLRSAGLIVVLTLMLGFSACNGGGRSHFFRVHVHLTPTATMKRTATATIGGTSSATATTTATASSSTSPTPSATPTGLSKVNHIIIAMQENHSFDNYFGVLPYHSGGPYHAGPCASNDNTCVNALSCTRDMSGNYTCTNSNKDDDGSTVTAFHSNDYCPAPDLDHGWGSTHKEANFNNPNDTLMSMIDDGFVLVNDATEQVDNGKESTTDDDTIGFFNETDLPYYYGLAETFAISDTHHADVLGPTFPNRSYFQAATSFGHLDTAEEVPTSPGGYKVITGTIYDKLDAAGITWADYFTDLPDAGTFRTPSGTNFRPIAQFATDLQAGMLPQVAFVDPELAGVDNLATDEHPPHDIRAGEFYMQNVVVDPFRKSTSWNDSILIITYDEHGGFYDHAVSPAAPQGGALTPDGIAPGQCADNSSPPASTMPGGGANCSTSMADALALCPAFTPMGAYPSTCATFNQLGIRVPIVAVSPFSKPHYVSHVTGDHTAILALIEKRFGLTPLTARDAANLATEPLEDMFDFDNAPSQNANFSALPSAPMPNLVSDGNGDCNTTPIATPSGFPAPLSRATPAPASFARKK